jgi:hypothetical protein
MTEAEKYNYWLTFHRFQQNREKYFAPKIYKILNQQVNEFLHSYKQGLRGDFAFFNVSHQPIIDVLKPLYLDAGIVYGRKVRASINQQKAQTIGFNQRMIDLMTEYFLSNILSTAEGITNTTKELIQRVLIQATEQGEGFDWVVKELEGLGFHNRIRARLIARTETVTAANQGAMFAAKDTGLLLNKEWLATSDKRTRHDHRIVNGQKIGMTEYFTLPENITMQQPGARTQENGMSVPAKEVINCRCTTIFEPVRDGRGKLVRA